jgi:dihydroorotase
MQRNRTVIKNGRVIDPAQGIDRVADLLIADGKVSEITDQVLEKAPDDHDLIDASGLVVAPGFIDLHTHLRDPGYEWKETLESGTQAAARGGFTTVCAMPNTDPCQDSAAVIDDVTRRAARTAVVRVLPIGAITKGRKGKNLAPMGELADAGVIGFSDDGDPVSDPNVMRQALSYATSLNLPIINHAEERSLVRGGVMNEGDVATRLGLPGVPASAEAVMIARDIELAALTGGRLHVPHVSTAASVELIRAAKSRGLNVTAEVTPHHLSLTESWVYGLHGEVPDAVPVQAYDTNTKVNPPLRSAADVAAVVEALSDGTIDIIATDHAPHAATDKICTYNEAAHGINVLETAFAQVMRLVHEGLISLPELIRRLTELPAGILDMQIGSLAKGSQADIVLLNPDADWKVEPADFASMSRNSPLEGVTLKGQVVATIFGGDTVWDTRSAETSASTAE